MKYLSNGVKMDKETLEYIIPKENLSKKAYNLLSAVTQSPAEELLLNNNLPELVDDVIKEHIEMREQIVMLTEENEKLQKHLKEYKKAINEIRELYS